MASRTAAYCKEPTEGLRERSPEKLRAALGWYMAASEQDAVKDWRDVLVGFAAYFDCAKRLGVDVVGLFETCAKGRSTPMRELASTFARRTDVTLEAFGWVLVERDGGPCYRPAP